MEPGSIRTQIPPDKPGLFFGCLAMTDLTETALATKMMETAGRERCDQSLDG